jgi:hypothetical protein
MPTTPIYDLPYPGYADQANVPEDLSELALATEAALETKIDAAADAWVAADLSNSWVNYGVGHVAASYVKDALGFVHIRGLVKNGTSAVATIFTLPADYRPATIHLFATDSNGAFAAIRVDPDGQVHMVDGGSTASVEVVGCFRTD